MQQRVVRTRIVIPYEPRPAFMPMHERQQRWGIMVAHRRAGKTVACVNELNRAAITCTKQDGRFAYIAPFYNQAKDVAWTYLKRYATPIPGVEVNESELRIDYPNGARARLYGADNADRLRGGYLDGVILDEYADMHPGAWGEVIRPMLADRQGWALFIGTPKGRNDFFKMWERAQADKAGWFTLMLKASNSGLLLQRELDDARLEMTAEQYEQEFECSFDAAILGAYFGKEMADADRAGRIGTCEIDPALPLEAAWDLGVDDPTAIWVFQIAKDGVRVVDYYENNGHPAPAHYVAELQSRGYKISRHWLPHDVKAKELTTGRTRIEVFQQVIGGTGAELRLIPMHQVIDGINAARLTLARCWFDADKCKYGIEALRQYRSEYDDKAKVFKTRPKHDWTSHGADAFRYLAMAWRELRPQQAPTEPVINKSKILPYGDKTGRIQFNMTIDEMIAQHIKEQSQE